MKSYYLLWNPDTGRCHGVPEHLRKACRQLIRITGVPANIALPEVCILVEKRFDLRQRGEGTYAELRKKVPVKQRKAG